ncbi:MAG: MBL fold metallo-hydrolase [Candidatus Micrarchaeota archaeon]
MEIVFLGTGGGRINLIRQLRWTGGFRINSAIGNFHVDPGPGALLRSWQIRQNPEKIDVLIVTHAHIDHCSDANVMIEAMSNYALKKKGIFIGSRNVLEDADERSITTYHKEHVNEIFYPAFADGNTEKHSFTTKKGSFDMEFIKVRHDEPTSFGFKLMAEGKTIGCTSDTSYFPELGTLFSGCDYLLINVLKPKDDGIPDHLETAQAIELLKVAKPKVALLNHMGLSMIRAGPEAQARLIQDATGIRTIAPKDGQLIKIGLGEFF